MKSYIDYSSFTVTAPKYPVIGIVEKNRKIYVICSNPDHVSDVKNHLGSHPDIEVKPANTHEAFSATSKLRQKFNVPTDCVLVIHGLPAVKDAAYRLSEDALGRPHKRNLINPEFREEIESRQNPCYPAGLGS